MSKTMFDAAFLPSPVPDGFDVAAGYVYQTHQEAAHIWTPSDWRTAALKCRYLLPIATCWTPFGDARNDAFAAQQAWAHVVQVSGWAQATCAFGLDMEISVANSPGAAAYATAWRSEMWAYGYYGIVYSSYSARQNLGVGPVWLGPPAYPAEKLANGSVVDIAQQFYLGSIDTNRALDTVPFYDTRPGQPAPVPSTTTGARMIERTTTGKGYWVVDSTGAVFAYGDATYHGGANTTHLNAPIVGMASTPTNGGYWLVGQDGGVFAFGDAVFYGAPVGHVH